MIGKGNSKRNLTPVDHLLCDTKKVKMKLNKKAQLCFVEPNSNRNLFWLWFVDDLSEAHGDDWNDAYWEHNASEPLNEDAFAVPIDLKVEGSYNWFEYPPDTASVDTINAGGHSWLYGVVNKKDVAFKSGMTLEEITQMVTDMGGVVFLPSKKTPIKLPLTKKEFTKKVVEYFRRLTNISYDLTSLHKHSPTAIADIINTMEELEKIQVEADEYWSKNYNSRWELT
jgi:hypothetical protein